MTLKERIELNERLGLDASAFRKMTEEEYEAAVELEDYRKSEYVK